jgi:two-component system sensor kinase FixL
MPDIESSSSKQASSVVCLDASAGEPEALAQFFGQLPGGTGVAYVVQHLALGQQRRLIELLHQQATLPVTEGTQGMRLAPDHVYIIPPGKASSRSEGRLHLLDVEGGPAWRAPVGRFFAHILGQISDGVVALDTQRRVTYLNQAMAALLHLDADEAVGRPLKDLFTCRWVDTEDARWSQAVLQARGRWSGRVVLVRPDGEEISAQMRVSDLTDEAGNQAGRLVVLRDVTGRNEAGWTIKASHLQFRALFENALDAFLLADDDAHFVDCNPAACSLLGYERSELLRETVASVSAGVPVDRFAARWKDFLAVGTQGAEYQMRRRDGRVIDVEYRAVAHILPGLHLSILRDVTERKQREHALRESEQRFRSLFEHSPDAIFVGRRDGRILDVNPAACRLHNAERDVLIGLNVRDLVPSDRRVAALQDFEKLATGGANDLQGYGWKVDGQGVPVEIRANRFVYDGQEALLLIVRDISKRIEAEEALKESQIRAQVILETTPDAVITTDEQGCIESVNPAAERIFGYRGGDMIGQNVTLLMPVPYQEERDMYLRRYLETGEGKIMGVGREVVARRKDGSTFPADLSVSEVRLGSRRVFTGFIRDISDRRRLEQEVLRISEEERQRIGQDIHDELASQFIGIALLSRNLADQRRQGSPVDTERLEELVRLAREGAEQARTLAQGLSPVKLDREGLIAALTQLVHSAEVLSGMTCTLDLDEELPPLERGVAIQLYRIAQEAVNNTVKHAGATHLWLEGHREKDHLVLIVRDNGVGFSADASEAGGLGLHIMPYRARMINATLRIDAAPGVGTTVACAVPLAEARHAG